MVSGKEYRKRSSAFWVGKKVRTRGVLRNGVIEIPTGTICEIRRKFKGFTLKTDPCKCCGVSVFISKVPALAVELVDSREMEKK